MRFMNAITGRDFRITDFNCEIEEIPSRNTLDAIKGKRSETVVDENGVILPPETEYMYYIWDDSLYSVYRTWMSQTSPGNAAARHNFINDVRIYSRNNPHVSIASVINNVDTRYMGADRIKRKSGVCFLTFSNLLNRNVVESIPTRDSDDRLETMSDERLEEIIRRCTSILNSRRTASESSNGRQ